MKQKKVHSLIQIAHFGNQKKVSGAFNALASSMGCKDIDTAVNWADNALKYWKSYDGKVRK